MKILLTAWLSIVVFQVISQASPDKPASAVHGAFETIYREAYWGRNSEGQARSGEGSEPGLTKEYLEFLQNFIQERSITSIVDVGCGDWALFSRISLDGIQYTGFDVVKSLIDHHNARYAKSNIRFVYADASQVDLPSADLLIVKEVLQHLPQKEVLQILNQTKKFKYAILINDVDGSTKKGTNSSIHPGHYTTVSLDEPPYSLKGKAIMHYKVCNNFKEVFLIENNKKK